MVWLLDVLVLMMSWVFWLVGVKVVGLVVWVGVFGSVCMVLVLCWVLCVVCRCRWMCDIVCLMLFVFFFGVRVLRLVVLGSLMLMERWLVWWFVCLISLGLVLGMVLRWM